MRIHIILINIQADIIFFVLQFSFDEIKVQIGVQIQKEINKLWHQAEICKYLLKLF